MSGSVDLGGRRIIKKIFFKQKTAYEIVTGDWSSDVCSSDLAHAFLLEEGAEAAVHLVGRHVSHVRALVQRLLCFVQIGRASCRERV